VNVLDLFSGIGGFSLGLERAGMRTVAFCEIEPYCRAVLKKHWPDIPIYDDVRTLEPIECDVICGGFPCQNISSAGDKQGIDGPRSGLWLEYARLIRDIRPKYAIVENVSALLSRGMGDVLGDLAEIGYDAEWQCVPAYSAGLPHARDRVWIVAYPNGVRELQPGWGLEHERRWTGDRGQAIDWVLSGGGVLRSHDGIPAGLDRIGPLGNAVVPRISEIIGRAIMQAEGLA
jgi:DNA (cytosine-5)-methyltransferase 1